MQQALRDVGEAVKGLEDHVGTITHRLTAVGTEQTAPQLPAQVLQQGQMAQQLQQILEQKE